MFSFTQERQNRGFTMIEIMTVLAIFGILVAIGTPSFISMNNRARLKNRSIELNSTLLEVQRSAIRTGKSCVVTLPTSGTNSPTIDSPCSISGNLTLNDIQIRTDISSISFNYRGDTSTSTTTKGTIVFALPDGSEDQKCLVVSPGIGLMRSGNYDPSDRTGTDPNKCYSSR